MVDWNDKQFVLLKVEKDDHALRFASEELRNDKEVVLAAVKQNGFNLHHVSTEMKNDKEVVLTAVLKNGNALKYASDELKNDKEVVLAAVEQSLRALYHASTEMKNDKEVMLAAVLKDGHALRCASDELKNDKEVVLTAVLKHGHALQYASDELKDDKEVVLAAVEQSWRALEDASTEMKNDKEVVLAAVLKNGLALWCASDELKNDKEVVLTAVLNNGHALHHASTEMKDDKEVVLTAVNQNGLALQYASNELKNYGALKYASEEIVLAAVNSDGFALQYAPNELKNDKGIVLAAVTQNFMALQYASAELRNDKEIVLAARPRFDPSLDQYAGTPTRSVKRWINLENKTKITNESNRNIEVVISHHEVKITFSAKGELGVNVCNVAKLGGSFNETEEYAPRKPEMAVVFAGKSESFFPPHKDYYLTIMSTDPSKGFVVHESNRRVLSKQNWTFEQQDLTKVLRQSKTVLSNNSDRNIIAILSYHEVSASAAASNIRKMVGINTLETEAQTATATQTYVILANTTEYVNISEQIFFLTTISEDPMLGHIIHESNRSVACKDGYSFTQNYLKKNLGFGTLP